ncbi:Curli production assembly/transport component CsgG [Bizionia myxarmorum]|uniref:Curli production assembly/transport component CsgG n=1 Tax=Bizionia myxarmorum TaxID=291186 RepID=A0A5D0RDY0_9FLAO|nr:Curli production assembly/transport component CsgG [Bizionia myxarmorum]TYB79523.1 Curli production assembly/transport component CsgG [Bizionia myxarmorum]
MKCFTLKYQKSIFKKQACFLLLVVAFFNGLVSWSQINSTNPTFNALPQTDFYDYRGTNAVSTMLGTALINGDYANPEFGYYYGIGYKKSLIPHINVNLTFNKFNLIDKGVFKDGFISIDFNAEILAFPHERFSPFGFIGGGVHASNYFESAVGKAQAGLGIEYVIYESFIFRLFGEYNEVFEPELTDVTVQTENVVYWRIAGGFNFYFGGKKKKAKLLNATSTIIKTNPIPTDK